MSKYRKITYILEIGIPDLLWRNMRDNRLPQTSPQETDMAMWGDWDIKRNTYSLCCRYNHSYPCKHIKQLYFILGKK